jgi:hypothetical protein
MNYKIITNTGVFLDFVEWLPELQDNECYYLCLFARSKYCKNEDGSNKFPHIKSDKSQLKRFVVSKKEHIYDKVKHLETKIGSYKTKDGMAIPQEALSLYITVNPRNQQKALFILMKRLIDIQECKGINFNLNAEALSAIQKAKSRSCYIDFDYDNNDPNFKFYNLKEWIYDRVGYNSDVKFLMTRGGYHILINPEKVEENYKSTWYNSISKNQYIDIIGDNMIPVPGTYQGGFTPLFIK